MLRFLHLVIETALFINLCLSAFICGLAFDAN